MINFLHKRKPQALFVLMAAYTLISFTLNSPAGAVETIEHMSKAKNATAAEEITEDKPKKVKKTSAKKKTAATKDTAKKTAAKKTTRSKKPAQKKKSLAQSSAPTHITLQLEGGNVVIRLRPDLAPGHVERIIQLTNEGFYNGVPFHRVIPGFMAQTGDPTGTGMGGSTYPDLKAEFTNTPHVRGTVSMARAANPNSANSQFFICYAPSQWLDGQYTVWGEVESGMELIDALPKGQGSSGMVQDPALILKVIVGDGKAKG